MTAQERKLFTDAYTHKGKYSADMLNQFLDNPAGFTIRANAIRRAYEDFVMRPAGLNMYAHPAGETEELAMMAYANGVLRNVRIELEWGYSSTLGGNAPIKNLIADVQQDDGSCKTEKSGGVAFSLEDWIQPITTA